MAHSNTFEHRFEVKKKTKPKIEKIDWLGYYTEDYDISENFSVMETNYCCGNIEIGDILCDSFDDFVRNALECYYYIKGEHVSISRRQEPNRQDYNNFLDTVVKHMANECGAFAQMTLLENQKNLLHTRLIRNGFKLVGSARNSNSGNMLHMYVLVKGKK